MVYLIYIQIFFFSLSLSEICMIHIYMVVSEHFPVSQEFFPSISESRKAALAPASIVRRKAGRCFEWTGSSDRNLQILFFSLRFEGSQINLHSHDMINNAVSFCHQHFFAQLLFRPSPPTKCPQNSDSGSAQEAGNAFVSNDSWSWQKATVRIAIPGRIISTSFFFVDL